MKIIAHAYKNVFLKGRVWLIDFNPFGEVTDSLLFTWEELTSGKNLTANQTQEDSTLVVLTWKWHRIYIKPFYMYCTASILKVKCAAILMPHILHFFKEGPAFRYTTSEVTVQPSPCLSYRIPRDFLDLTTGEDAYKLIDFLKLVSEMGIKTNTRTSVEKDIKLSHLHIHAAKHHCQSCFRVQTMNT